MKTYTKKEVRELFEKHISYLCGTNNPKATTQQFLKDNNLLDELEAGKWYKRESDRAIFCFSGEYDFDNNPKGYGFLPIGWVHKYSFGWGGKWQEATEQEVKEALIAEAKRRGFKEGVMIRSAYGRNTCVITSDTLTLAFSGIDRVYLKDSCHEGFGNTIYNKGKWATIIDEPKEMTVEEISKALGHEVKIVK